MQIISKNSQKNRQQCSAYYNTFWNKEHIYYSTVKVSSHLCLSCSVKFTETLYTIKTLVSTKTKTLIGSYTHFMTTTFHPKLIQLLITLKLDYFTVLLLDFLQTWGINLRKALIHIASWVATLFFVVISISAKYLIFPIKRKLTWLGQRFNKILGRQ